jgi:hypothetical protein
VDTNYDKEWSEKTPTKPVHFKRRVTHCTRMSPLPLLPSGPGGVGGIASRRTRHNSMISPALLLPEALAVALVE